MILNKALSAGVKPNPTTISGSCWDVLLGSSLKNMWKLIRTLAVNMQKNKWKLSHMNSQLLRSVKDSRTCDHLNVEFEIPEWVSRMSWIVWTFSSVESHLASSGEFGKNIRRGMKMAKVKTAQMIWSHFHELIDPAKTPALLSRMSLYAIIVNITFAMLPNAHHKSCTHGLFFGGKNAWWRMAVEGTIWDSVWKG